MKGVKKKEKWVDKNNPLPSQRDSLGSQIINSIDSARIMQEQKEYDMQYKSYFGHESLDIHPHHE